MNPRIGQACWAAARRALAMRASVAALVLTLWAAVGSARADCLWDSGPFDQRTAQTSLATVYGDQQVADDIFIRPREICRLDRITVTLIGNSIIPKARLKIYDDCDGTPGALLYTLDTTQLTDSGQVYSGFQVFTAQFNPVDLWLAGGTVGRTYWVSVMGVAATPTDHWYWASAGGAVNGIKGLPGKFIAPASGVPNWISVAELGCGCTDFQLKIEGSCCGVVWDGGAPDPSASSSSSLITGIPGGTFDTRAADDFVTPTCRDLTVCFIRAVVYSNCTPMRGVFEIYGNDCQLPTGAPIFSAPFSKSRDLGYTVAIDGASLRAYEVELYEPGWVLPAGRNYWLSAVGQGGGSLQQRAYFAHSVNPCSSCPALLNSGATRAPAIVSGAWSPLTQTIGQSRDFSFLIAARDLPAQTGALPHCSADFNQDGSMSTQDVLDYLSSWFSGCP